MKFYFETKINASPTRTFALFRDRSSYKKWQPGLIRDELTRDKKGNTIYEMAFRVGRRTLIIKEKIYKDAFPVYNSEYNLKGVKNISQNTFEAFNGNTTVWKQKIEFRFTGLMKLIGVFMRKGLEEQSRIIIKNFKSFAESN